MTHLPENRALSYKNRDVSCENRALSYINRDVNYKVPEDRALSYKNRDVSCENRALSYENRDVSCKDSYLLFRNKYLISNVVNSRPESARPLHSYLIKVQGTTIIVKLGTTETSIRYILRYNISVTNVPNCWIQPPCGLARRSNGDPRL
jgi:hypothetical protein